MNFILRCAFLCTFAVISNTFVLREHFHNNTLAANPALFQHLEQYISMHSAQVVLNESRICDRNFIVATYACPQAMGNHMHEFLNNYAGAFITNKTVVWKFCNRKPCQLDNEGDCNEQTTRFPWMLSEWDFERKWQHDKCDPATYNGWHQLIPAKFKFQADQILICCGLDVGRFANDGPRKTAVPRVDYGTLELHEFYALSSPSARLSVGGKARAKELFRLGEDFAYGVLFRSTFKINKAVSDLADNIISHHERQLTLKYQKESVDGKTVVVKPFYIGLHLRHSNADNNENAMDKHGVQCVNRLWGDFQNAKLNNGHSKASEFYKTIVTSNNELIAQNAQNIQDIAQNGGVKIIRPCVILLASDRKHEIDLWKNTTHLLHNGVQCSVLSSNHSVGAHIAWNEHGPFSGGLAVQDLDLLSRSDLFIGSSYAIPILFNVVSTFSMLIGALRATNGRPHAIDIRSRFLGECEGMLGARHAPNEAYVTQTEGYKCGNSLQIMLPIECPYWNKTSIE